jgi:hypothetical protein
MANRCQLCNGFTTTLRRGLCRVCFDGNVRPSELFDEMALLARARPAKASLPARPGTARARVHPETGTNGTGGHLPARAAAGSGSR